MTILDVEYNMEKGVFEVEIVHKGAKIYFEFNPKTYEIEVGHMKTDWWSWDYGDEFPGLFVGRLLLSSLPDWMFEEMEKKGLTSAHFKELIKKDVLGFVYALIGDNSFMDYGDLYNDLEEDFVEYYKDCVDPEVLYRHNPDVECVRKNYYMKIRDELEKILKKNDSLVEFREKVLDLYVLESDFAYDLLREAFYECYTEELRKAGIEIKC